MKIHNIIQPEVSVYRAYVRMDGPKYSWELQRVIFWARIEDGVGRDFIVGLDCNNLTQVQKGNWNAVMEDIYFLSYVPENVASMDMEAMVEAWIAEHK